MDEKYALEILERIKNRPFKPEIPEELVEKSVEKAIEKWEKEQIKSDVIKCSEELYAVFKKIYTEGGAE